MCEVFCVALDSWPAGQLAIQIQLTHQQATSTWLFVYLSCQHKLFTIHSRVMSPSQSVRLPRRLAQTILIINTIVKYYIVSKSFVDIRPAFDLTFATIVGQLHEYHSQWSKASHKKFKACRLSGEVRWVWRETVQKVAIFFSKIIGRIQVNVRGMTIH